MQVRVRRFASGVCLLNARTASLAFYAKAVHPAMVEAVKTKGFALDKKGGVVVNMKREGCKKRALAAGRFKSHPNK